MGKAILKNEEFLLSYIVGVWARNLSLRAASLGRAAIGTKIQNPVLIASHALACSQRRDF